MIQSIKQTAMLLNLNSRLFINALDGLTDAQATARISAHSNPLNWLGSHTIWARYLLCDALGMPNVENPYKGMFENFKPFEAESDYQSLAVIKEEWAKATTLLNEALAAVTEERLATVRPGNSPINDNTYAGFVAFLSQHESYDIGQMALLKKYFTGEAMKYA